MTLICQDIYHNVPFKQVSRCNQSVFSTSLGCSTTEKLLIEILLALFHKPSIPASLRVLTLLKQVSAHASETATEDQATDHTHQNKLQRTEFELNITEDPPTVDQLRTILEYMGASNASRLVEGAKDSENAIQRLRENPKTFRPPLVSAPTPRKLNPIY